MPRCGTAYPRLRRALPLALAVTLVAPAVVLAKPSLTPTRPALLRQVYAARDHGYTYLRTEADVFDFARKGYLVELRGNRDYLLKHDVPYPYARPEVKIFIERLAEQYRDQCGERLVVTSLVRPKSRQPRNSSPLSVHPTGMAIDFRIPANAKCRSWIEMAFLNLERGGVLEAARERRPPHYHVVLFPNPYTSYLARVHGIETGAKATRIAEARPAEARPAEARPAEARAATPAPAVTKVAATATTSARRHTVRSGDSLWTIARRYGTSVAALQGANGLSGSRLRLGQVLTVPAAGAATVHKVRSGDSLWTIARRYDTSIDAVRRVNGLRSASLRPGQVLTIPAD